MGCSARLHPHDNPLKKYKGLRPPATPAWARTFTRKSHSPQEIDKKTLYILSIVDRGERRSREPKYNSTHTIQLYLSNQTYYITSHLGLRPFIIPITPARNF